MDSTFREPEDRQLDHLVRRALARASRPVPRPRTKLLIAYLAGVATDDERRDVRSALLASRALRSRLLRLARKLEGPD